MDIFGNILFEEFSFHMELYLVNTNQTCFETLTKIVQRIQRDLLPGLNDIHGRNRLLLTYIHYEYTLHTPSETGASIFFGFSFLVDVGF